MRTTSVLARAASGVARSVRADFDAQHEWISAREKIARVGRSSRLMEAMGKEREGRGLGASISRKSENVRELTMLQKAKADRASMTGLIAKKPGGAPAAAKAKAAEAIAEADGEEDDDSSSDESDEDDFHAKWLNFESETARMKRKALRRHPQVVRQVQTLWDTALHNSSCSIAAIYRLELKECVAAHAPPPPPLLRLLRLGTPPPLQLRFRTPCMHATSQRRSRACGPRPPLLRQVPQLPSVGVPLPARQRRRHKAPRAL